MVFKDTRLPAATVIENLEDLSVDEVMEQFDVPREQINAVLDFVAQSAVAGFSTGHVSRQIAPGKIGHDGSISRLQSVIT